MTSFNDLFFEILKMLVKSNGWERGPCPIGMEEKMICKRGMKKKTRQQSLHQIKRMIRDELHQNKLQETFEQTTLVLLSVFMLRSIFPIFSAIRRNNLYSKHNLL